MFITLIKFGINSIAVVYIMSQMNCEFSGEVKLKKRDVNGNCKCLYLILFVNK